jgi:uncharacterized membrane protein
VTGPDPPGTYARGSEEFGRVLAFSDGVFAIAATLLVVGITVPELNDVTDQGELARALEDRIAAFVSFAISFAVIGRYWIAHHRFFGQLRGADSGLVWINLVYLGFVAFLPFPTALLGSFFENPVAIASYAPAVALVSGFEVLLFRHAYRAGLLTREMPAEVFRWGAMMSLAPVMFFLGSIPVAFLSTVAAVAFWFLGLPFAIVANRWKPEHADEWLLG